MNKDRGHIHLVIGGSKLGTAIALKHARDGKYVTLIDKDSKAKYKLGDDYPGAFIHGDATHINVLKDANIESVKEVVVVTNRDDINIYLANLIYKIYGKKNIVIRLNDVTKMELLASNDIKVINNFLEAFDEYNNILKYKGNE